MRRYLRTIVPVLVAAAGMTTSLVACGTSPTPHPGKVLKAVAGHKCSTSDYFMQCALTTPTQRLSPVQVKVFAFGQDFGWSCPNTGSFGASYLSWDASKNWTPACVARYHARHAATVAVWETTATRSTDGFSAGESDARAAASQLAALGAPARQPFDLAIDFDAAGPEVAAYFRGADAAEPGRINAYGGYRPLLWLFQHKLVGHLNWQTYAWSGGAWLPASIAPLEQYLNGSTVDQDRAIARAYGQWPVPVAPKPKPPHCWSAADFGACPIPQPSTFNVQFDQGFQRGFTVHWARRHHRKVPSLGHSQSWFNHARQSGYDAGYNRIH